MKKASAFSLLAGTLIVSILFYSSSNFSQASKEKVVAKSLNSSVQHKKGINVENVNIHMDFVKSYNSSKDLANAADIVVEGNVLDTQYFDFNTNTFTKLTFEVTKSFNNQVKKGDIISVIEIGGITTKRNLQKYDPDKLNVPANELDDQVSVKIDNAPLSKKGDQILIFAKEDKDNFYKLNEKVYEILNTYQGKFTIDKVNNKVHRYQDSSNKKDPLDMSLTNMENQLQNQ